MKLILKPVRPRNPVVVAMLRRKSGAHRAGGGARRQEAEAALRRELERLAKGDS